MGGVVPPRAAAFALWQPTQFLVKTLCTAP